MIQLHFDVKQLKIGKTVDVLHSCVSNYVKYANMEGFRRDSHICSDGYCAKILCINYNVP